MHTKKSSALLDALKKKESDALAAESADDDLMHSFNLPEARFDRICIIARKLLRSPVAVISFIADDAPWTKSCVGMPASHLPPDPSLCAYAVAGDEVFHVEDLALDPRFSTHPWAGRFGAKFYAAAPIRSANGEPIGALAVIDRAARTLSANDAIQLEELASLAEAEIRLAALAERNKELLAEAAKIDSLQASDKLTGLWNSSAARGLASRELARGMRGSPTSLALVRIDGLDAIYAKHGALVGDKAVIGVSEAIRHCVRDFDIVGRDADDVFLLALSDCPAKQSLLVCERLRKFVAANAIHTPQGQIKATVSIGIASCASGPLSLDKTIEAASYELAQASEIRNACSAHPALI